MTQSETPPSLYVAVQREISYKTNFTLLLEKDKVVEGGRWYFQVQAKRIDTVTGKIGYGRGGKAYLSPHMTKSELVRLAFGLFLAYEEHECREYFKWNGKRVFGPHIDVVALWDAAHHIDARPTT